jgi:protein-L-isoaspartate(D-aspartate) O-methyltransferase
VLDVGSGSGYLTACMGVMVKPDGVAYGIEHVPELVHWSEQNMQKSSVGKELMEAGNVVSLVRAREGQLLVWRRGVSRL